MNGESRGFGFVDMKDDEGADEVQFGTGLPVFCI